ncbi:lmo0954 family membrane protein [Salisediminibacterium selenitireducens]|uniref:Flagellar basal body rod protein n=1 Tax=Bacillus selenitireducens (strain ATCC 700615 / DSM 15326 / MLS10) TaxID=439292 RepID=D6XT04_BACIE|nr:hypothetical protein [Salisediminibacterium selenitireducens]ADH98940.1 hypothetical protein Bsel_1428 [[Bacillus] selenitireducens MLS10]
MKSFGLFLVAIIALFILLANLGPMILFALGVYLLYVIWKKFNEAQETGAKVFWIIAGLIVFSMTLSNIYALVGVFAVYILYVLFVRNDGPKKGWTKNGSGSDPFDSFDREWSSTEK